MVLSEDILKIKYRKEPFDVFEIEKGTLLTPSAKQFLNEKGIEQSHLFTSQEKPAECTDYVNSNVFAIDFDEKAVRVARTLNLIAGDGQTNVLHLNTLDYERWENTIKTEDWTDTYNEG